MNLPVPIVENPKFHNLFLDFVKTINLRSHAYPLSDCRQFFNEILEKKKVTGGFNFQFIFFVCYSVRKFFP